MLERVEDDALALAIAMVNGLWVTMGDDQVREAVKEDSSSLLEFFRETNEQQRLTWNHQLEDYPLEAKVALVWTGGPHRCPEGGPFSLSGSPPTPSWYPVNLRGERV
jgi:hypothetical protein